MMLCAGVLSGLQAKVSCSSVQQTRSVYFKKTPPWLPKRPTEHREPSTCSLNPFMYPDKKPCFDISGVILERGTPCHTKLIRSFLYSNYWPREPSTVGVYMPLDSPYIHLLTEKYCTTGDRWVASEIQPRTKERRIVGVLVADKTFPWVPEELEQWAHQCCLVPERTNMYFRAHCLRAPNLFERYHLPYSYDIEVLATSSDVTGHKVALLLLRTAIMHAVEQRHPLIQICSKNYYTHGVCEKCGLKKEWEMDYDQFTDYRGQKVMFPRRPHKSVIVYIRKFNQAENTVPEACFYPEVFELYKEQVLNKKTIPAIKKRCDLNFPLFPRTCKP